MWYQRFSGVFDSMIAKVCLFDWAVCYSVVYLVMCRCKALTGVLYL